MIFFKRKKEKEEEEDLEKNSPSKQNFKNLEKKIVKKKVDPKPWGKKERILILSTFLLTVGISAVLGLSSREWKLPGFPRITLPLFKTKKIVIEVDEQTKENREKETDVISFFRDKTRDLSGVYGLYIIRLESGSSYGYFEDEIFEPASLNKLPALAAMYLQKEQGNIDLDSQYRLKNSDKMAGSGSLSSKPEGYVLTYRDLVKLMGKQSDNTAYNIVKNILGTQIVNEAIATFGMDNTVIFGEEQKTTPRDVGEFFRNLWQGSLLTKESRDELLAFMTDTNFESWIVGGIPSDVRVSHKFGRELHVVNDAGIVFASGPEGEESSGPDSLPGWGPFVLVILSKGVIENEADTIFPELAKAVYEIETR